MRARRARLSTIRARSVKPAITVLWMPRIGHAGLVHGGDAVWTDADSVQDAIERLLGDEGKEIDN